MPEIPANPCPQIADHPNLMRWLQLGRPCSCGADAGQAHDEDCDHARCMATGYQRLMCGAVVLHDEGVFTVGGDQPGHDCGTDIWPGFDREARDAINAGWFTTLNGSASVERDRPDAIPDYIRLRSEATWIPTTLAWEPITHDRPDTDRM